MQEYRCDEVFARTDGIEEQVKLLFSSGVANALVSPTVHQQWQFTVQTHQNQPAMNQHPVNQPAIPAVNQPTINQLVVSQYVLVIHTQLGIYVLIFRIYKNVQNYVFMYGFTIKIKLLKDNYENLPENAVLYTREQMLITDKNIRIQG